MGMEYKLKEILDFHTYIDWMKFIVSFSIQIRYRQNMA